ncbi:hypothetical protein ACFWPU_44965 [Streptomyces sp. NPDC058471]|uniref:hypothetical protein n=1 Tax=Streptomyces sp. NPDC058471 TaxID=3346516 RepID=UPI0036568B66
MPDDGRCDKIKGPAHKYCEKGDSPGDAPSPDDVPSGGGGIWDGASDHVKDLANSLLDTLNGLLAPKDAWAPRSADNWLYEQFLWLGQHLAVSIFVCVVVVCGLTAWQGAPRLRQMGMSTGWTLAAVAAMAAIPGSVMLLNKAIASAFTAAFDSNETTLFKTISQDLESGTDAGNPIGQLILISSLVVALAFAALVFMTRQLGILVFVCMAPLVLATLARGGDTTAVKKWVNRLLGLMFCPFALLAVSPFVEEFGGSLTMDGILLVGADVLMLRMLFHGVPYIGPKLAGAARGFVENRTSNPIARAAVRAGAPAFYEQENNPRQPRTVNTPGRAIGQDSGVLLAAYGLKTQQRSGRLTADSAIDKVQREAPHQQRLVHARQQARAAARADNPTPAPRPGAAPRPANPAPAPANPAPNPPRTP